MSARSSSYVAGILKVAALLTLFAGGCFPQAPAPVKPRVAWFREPLKMDSRSTEAFRSQRRPSAICAGVSLSPGRNGMGPVKPQNSVRHVCRDELLAAMADRV